MSDPSTTHNYSVNQLGNGNTYQQLNNIYIQKTGPGIDVETVNALIQDLPCYGEKFGIFVDSGRGQNEIIIQPSFSIRCVKHFLGLMHGVPPKNIILIFGKQILDDELSIEEYSIKKDDILHMRYHFRQSEDLAIEVQRENGRLFCVPIPSDITVEQVKEEIFKEERLPVQLQKLYIDGVELSDYKNVNDYGHLLTQIIILRDRSVLL